MIKKQEGLEGESLARFWASRVTDGMHHSMLRQVASQNILSSNGCGPTFLFEVQNHLINTTEQCSCDYKFKIGAAFGGTAKYSVQQ